jgi:enoyl-CoA hydratase
MTDPVTTTEEDTHVLLTMDDGKANALSFALLDALHDGLDRAQAAGKTVVIVGRPGRFSAGFDLNVMREGGEPMVRLLRRGAETAVRLMGFETPVVLGVSGHALAMGALLCLSADYRVGIRGDFKIGLNEVAIGMTLPWFGIELARARLAPTHVDRAVGLAQICDPDAAVGAGYLDEVVEADTLLGHVGALAQVLSGLDMRAHAATKRRLREPFFAAYEEALRRDAMDV